MGRSMVSIKVQQINFIMSRLDGQESIVVVGVLTFNLIKFYMLLLLNRSRPNTVSDNLFK